MLYTNVSYATTHSAKTCRKPNNFKVSDCSQKHHSLLQSWVRLSFNHSDLPPSINCASTKNNVHVVKNCFGVIPVVVRGENGKCSMYALLDDGADKTLCDEH